MDKCELERYIELKTEIEPINVFVDDRGDLNIETRQMVLMEDLEDIQNQIEAKQVVIDTDGSGLLIVVFNDPEDLYWE